MEEAVRWPPDRPGQRLTDTDHKNGKLPAGESYHLPTEAQWEYAWFLGNAKNVGEGYAHKVGLKNPNPWELHDMHGNVFEWCSDWYGRGLSGGTDPVGPGGGNDRVFRGGSWEFGLDFCRSALRGHDAPVDRSRRLGFRVARSQSAQ